MTIKHALVKYNNIEIDLLLAFVLKKSREFLYMHPEYRLTRKAENRLTRIVKRRKKGEPIAYILGYKDFYGLRFKVNKNVLIPRPETELMVEKVIQKTIPNAVRNPLRSSDIQALRDPSAPQNFQSNRKFWSGRDGTLKVLDVGTGSGCIAISLAKQLQISNIKFQITASDVLPKALEVAKLNAKQHKVNVKFIRSDLLENIKGKFDVIVGNLPYVPETDYRLLIKDLRFEPKSAIFAREKGLEVIHNFLKQISRSKILNPKSSIWLEFDPRQKKELSALIKKNLPSYKAEFFKDLNNLWRCARIFLS